MPLWRGKIKPPVELVVADLEEEDNQLDEEYGSGMKISEIAKIQFMIVQMVLHVSDGKNIITRCWRQEPC